MRERLTVAALELFAAQGFGETTIDQIAERADVARQTVLNHFPRKVDFARAWGEGRRARFAASGTGGADGEPAEASLGRYFSVAAKINEHERDLTRAMLRSLSPTEVFQYIGGVPTSLIERGRRQGDFAPQVDPSAAAEVLTSIYFGTLSRWLAEGPPPFDLRAALHARLDLVLAGLRAR